MPMKLNHVLVQTRNLDAMARFWTDVIGLTRGTRPRFPFAGAWLYSGAAPLVHLVEQPELTVRQPGALMHVALEGARYDALILRLKLHGTRYQEQVVPASAERQVFVEGPEGLLVELLFPVDTGVGDRDACAGAAA